MFGACLMLRAYSKRHEKMFAAKSHKLVFPAATPNAETGFMVESSAIK